MGQPPPKNPYGYESNYLQDGNPAFTGPHHGLPMYPSDPNQIQPHYVSSPARFELAASQPRSRSMPPMDSQNSSYPLYDRDLGHFAFNPQLPSNIPAAPRFPQGPQSYQPGADGTAPNRKRKRVRNGRSQRFGQLPNIRMDKVAATRPLLQAERERTPEQLAGMSLDNDGSHKFIDVNDVSDSQEDEMDIQSDLESEDGRLEVSGISSVLDKNRPEELIVPQAAQELLKGALSDGTPNQKWSNPDPYSALPPPNDAKAKKKDVVKLIRKARVAEKPQADVKATIREGFISLDSSGDERKNDSGSSHKMRAQGTLSTPVHANGKDGRESFVSTKASLRHLEEERALPSATLGKRKRHLESDDDLDEPPLPSKIRRAGNGRIVHAWAPLRGQTTTPWINIGSQKNKDVSIWLHEEIHDFWEYVRPQPQEQIIRDELVVRLSNVLCSRWKEASIHSFGSFAAGLYLPDADMDLVMNSATFTSGSYKHFEPARKYLYNIQQLLVAKDIAVPESIIVIAKSRVPLIKFVDRKTRLRVDLSLENMTGIIANKTFNLWKDQFPAMPIIVTLVKQLLAMRNLNDVSTGGLGGFSVTCLVTSLLQNMGAVQSRNMVTTRNLGEILMAFFELYGREFDIDRVGIRLSPPGYFEKSQHQFILYKNMNRLSIEDPNNASNDVSGGSGNIARVLKCFSDAYDTLRQRMVNLENASPADRVGKSILEPLLGGNYSSFTWHRKRLNELYQERHEEVRYYEDMAGGLEHSRIPQTLNLERRSTMVADSQPLLTAGSKAGPDNTDNSLNHTNLNHGEFRRLQIPAYGPHVPIRAQQTIMAAESNSKEIQDHPVDFQRHSSHSKYGSPTSFNFMTSTLVNHGYTRLASNQARNRAEQSLGIPVPKEPAAQASIADVVSHYPNQMVLDYHEPSNPKERSILEDSEREIVEDQVTRVTQHGFDADLFETIVDRRFSPARLTEIRKIAGGDMENAVNLYFEGLWSAPPEEPQITQTQQPVAPQVNRAVLQGAQIHDVPGQRPFPPETPGQIEGPERIQRQQSAGAQINQSFLQGPQSHESQVQRPLPTETPGQFEGPRIVQRQQPASTQVNQAFLQGAQSHEIQAQRSSPLLIRGSNGRHPSQIWVNGRLSKTTTQQKNEDRAQRLREAYPEHRYQIPSSLTLSQLGHFLGAKGLTMSDLKRKERQMLRSDPYLQLHPCQAFGTGNIGKENATPRNIIGPTIYPIVDRPLDRARLHYPQQPAAPKFTRLNDSLSQMQLSDRPLRELKEEGNGGADMKLDAQDHPAQPLMPTRASVGDDRLEELSNTELLARIAVERGRRAGNVGNEPVRQSTTRVGNEPVRQNTIRVGNEPVGQNTTRRKKSRREKGSALRWEARLCAKCSELHVAKVQKNAITSRVAPLPSQGLPQLPVAQHQQNATAPRVVLHPSQGVTQLPVAQHQQNATAPRVAPRRTENLREYLVPYSYSGAGSQEDPVDLD